LLLIVRPLQSEGAGNAGCPMHPQPGVRWGVVKYAHQYSQRRHRKHPAFPTQWFYGLYVISPGTGLFCPRHLADGSSAKLDTSVGVSGPHDFAVRLSAVRYRRLRVHRIPPRERDDRVSPLCWDGTDESIMLFLPSRQEKFRKIGNRVRGTIAPRNNSPGPANACNGMRPSRPPCGMATGRPII
jgi:hypothetical protein